LPAVSSSHTSSNTDKYKHKNIPIESILEYKARGLDSVEIAKLLGCDKSNIIKRLQHHNDKIASLPDYKKHKADVLALKQREILNNITPDKLNDASGLQLTTMFGILYDKERLERGQSTENVLVHELSNKISDLDAQEAELRAKYPELDDDSVAEQGIE